jgi:hypothetical protein
MNPTLATIAWRKSTVHATDGYFQTIQRFKEEKHANTHFGSGYVTP